MRRLPALLAAGCLVLVPLSTAGAEPGRQFPDPQTGIREDTPNDPGFDCSEPDDEDAPANGGTVENCGAIWEAQPQLWGFAPASTKLTAVHKVGPRAGQPMRAGIGTDAAWKTTPGRPDVAIAILDTGIRWDAEELRLQIALNDGELPQVPDTDGDGVVSVGDYAGLVDPALGADGPQDRVDAQDLIERYSDGVDDDGNGYVDDIAGWDFFDDDNDPHDASSYSSAGNHGTGRANDAARRGNDAAGEIGTCPSCTVIPVRVWDTFVVSGDHYGMGAAYAADAGAAVIEVALGALSNSPTAQAATRYAYDKGVTLAVVSSDLNTANHNFPTTYDEVIGVNGTVADTYGLGASEANEFGLTAGAVGPQAPVATYFRNSNLTQYGAHLHVSAVGDTGSFATGQAAGAFGLVIAAGREKGLDLTPAEVKQIVTLSAEDVLPEDTVGIGVPDPAQVGFDERFAYGRLDMAAAMTYVAEGKVPPTVLLRSPDWWQIVDPVRETTLPIVADTGSRAATHRVVVEAARGIEPTEFTELFETGDLSGSQDARDLGDVEVADLVSLFGAGFDPGKAPSDVNEFAVTLRLRVTDSAGNVGEHRKVVWLHHDPSWLPGFPQYTDRGGESSPRLADLDGDAQLEVVLTDSGGRTRVLDRTGRDVPWWNGGEGVLAPVLREALPHAAAPAYVSGVPLPRGVSLTPAVADLDGDGALEVVVTNSGGEITGYDRLGAALFTVGVDRSLSPPSVRTEDYHVKTGFFGAASVGDLVADSPGLEIVAGGLDGRVYAWTAAGEPVAGYPVSLNSADTGEAARGAELITIPTLAQLDGDPQVEIVIAGSEVVSSSGGNEPPASPTDLATAYRTLLQRVGTGAFDAASLAHALDGDGTPLDGWPVKLDALLPDVLPFVGPAHQFAAADVDGDGLDEVLVSNTSGEVVQLAADGTRRVTHASEVPATNPSLLDKSKVLNLFEYASVGDLEGAGVLSAFKGGLTLNGLVNLVLVGQNLPFDHTLQGWDMATGSYRPGFPAKLEDYTLLSQPAVADVDGLPGKEVVQGTGLYLVHAFDAAGLEAPGFPKFTGGWNYATPAVGDLDGDGAVEMVSSTREGYLFAWSTGGAASGNTEWWGAAHDDRSTSRYGTDARPPARVQGLERIGTTVTWAPTGDDWLVGTPARTVVVVGGTGGAQVSATAAGVRELAGDATSAGDVPVGARVEVYAVDDAGNRSLSAVLAPGATRPDGDGGGNGAGGGGGSGSGPDGGPDGGSDARPVRATSRLPATGPAPVLPAALALLALGAVVGRRLRT
ncbi:MAG TPA: S8 family serine peptidase [Mycobacteriales bacterium]|nr:S8 family serine peptidase [Mycobacteriales bacterium]